MGLMQGVSIDGSPSDTASSISSPSAGLGDTTPPLNPNLNLKQTHAHQPSILANPTASYGFYSPGFCSHTPTSPSSFLWVLDYVFMAYSRIFSGFDAALLGDMDSQAYYIAGDVMQLQYPVMFIYYFLKLLMPSSVLHLSFSILFFSLYDPSSMIYPHQIYPLIYGP